MEHPGDKHIDPRLLAKIKQSEKDGGIFLKDIPDSYIVEAHTQNSVYTVAVIDKDKSKVAVLGNNKYLAQPEVCYLRGSTFGGSMIKLGWIGVGMHLEINPAVGGIITTSSIKTVKVKKDAKSAKELVKKALVTAPKEVTREEVENSIRQFVHDKFPVAMKVEVTTIINDFSLNGQIVIASLLWVAHRYQKFYAAKQLIARYMQEHWGYQAPEVRGDPDFTQKNAWYLEQAYKELGLPLLSEEAKLVYKDTRIPTKVFVVKTRNSVYRFGKADKNGARTVSRDNKSLNFTRCKIAILAIEQEMKLDCLDGSSPNWYTTIVRAIEK